MKLRIVSYSLILILIISFVVNSGCITNNKTNKEPITGTWNGYVAKIDGQTNLLLAAFSAGEISKIRFNIYDDNSFEYNFNYNAMTGKLIPTGKGNYIVQSSDNDTFKRYVRYDEQKDILSLETLGVSIEFRRNGKIWTHDDFVNYFNNLVIEYNKENLALNAPTPTPIPTIKKEIASIKSGRFGFDPNTETLYTFTGEVSIASGVYNSVEVIIRYSDGAEYKYNAGGMGGANSTIKSFTIFPDSRYKYDNPNIFIKLDTIEYPVLSGVASEF